MSEPSALIPAGTEFATQRRDLLLARAKRAGCGVLRVANSMEELLALACIGKAARAARTETSSGAPGEAPGGQTPAPHDPAPAAQDAIPAGAFDAPYRNAPAGAPDTAGDSLLGGMLRTSGRVVSLES